MYMVLDGTVQGVDVVCSAMVWHEPCLTSAEDVVLGQEGEDPFVEDNVLLTHIPQ